MCGRLVIYTTQVIYVALPETRGILVRRRLELTVTDGPLSTPIGRGEALPEMGKNQGPARSRDP
jgi:hypothetical protein